jgi:MraZ protein
MSAENSNGPTYNSRYDNVVDEKRRIQIPSKWRTPGETEFMLILWPNGAEKDACLMVLPPPAAYRLKEKVNALPFGDPQAEALRRFLGRKSDTVYSDKTGRITLPEQMAKAAGIVKEVVQIGMFDRFQLWNPAKYDGEVVAGEDALATEAFKLI